MKPGGSLDSPGLLEQGLERSAQTPAPLGRIGRTGNREGGELPKVTEPARALVITPASLTAWPDGPIKGPIKVD